MEPGRSEKYKIIFFSETGLLKPYWSVKPVHQPDNACIRLQIKDRRPEEEKPAWLFTVCVRLPDLLDLHRTERKRLTYDEVYEVNGA